MSRPSKVTLWVIEVRLTKHGDWHLYGASILSAVFDRKLTAQTAISGAKTYNKSERMSWQFRVSKFMAVKP